MARFAVYLAIIAAVVVSIQTVEVIPEFLFAPNHLNREFTAEQPNSKWVTDTKAVETAEGWLHLAVIVDLFSRMWPVEFAYYPHGVHHALMETIHIASLGTLLALVLALPVGLLAAHNICPYAAINLFARFILVSSRSVNSLVWALLFVGIFGPGALAGTLAIAFRSIGFVGKLFGEALEEMSPRPIEALTAVGAPRASLLVFGYWPQVKPAFWSIALFRWDINVRESAVLGLVGAGGIGMTLDSALNLFQWNRIALILVAIFAVVVAAEIVVTFVRKRVL